MQVIILAAGMGTRLKNKTKNHTKSMVEILGKTFLEHSLDKLTKFNISKIIIVIGYCGEEIKEKIGNSYNNVPIIYVENKDYQTTNNIYSFFLTKEYLSQEDTLLLESDLIYDEEIIERLLSDKNPNVAVIDKYKAYMDGTVVKINDDNDIVSFVPKEYFDYKEINSYYKTVNIYKFSKDFLINDYIPFLTAYCQVMGKSAYYEQVLKVLLSLERRNIKVLIINEERWFEVDDLQDYNIAECLFCPDIKNKLQMYHSRYGGYWRFDRIKDFCYLVNPYFPPIQMSYEIKSSFISLLESYPSGQNIQKSLISNTFNIDENYVLVGNGAAELIDVLLSSISGKIGVILPTFQEYPSRINSNSELVTFLPDNKDFSYSINDLKAFASKIDTLILINPDNPSGNFINRTDVLDLIDFYKSLNKSIILDESFVDFSDDLENNSLLEDKILKEYANLIIIKSISKSYGVPGIRLGILATSNDDLLKICNKKLPIWNINSYAEFFLQILNKYKKSYNNACQKIVDNRTEFHKKLELIKFISPIKSQANYILCEVLAPYSSDKLAEELLKHNVLVKDCQNKMGFNGRQYMRLAVKSKEDNNFIIEVLKTL